MHRFIDLKTSHPRFPRTWPSWTAVRSGAFPRLLAQPGIPFILALGMTILAGSLAASAQEPEASTASIEQSQQRPIPNLVRYEGTLLAHAGMELKVRFSIYATQTSESVLWQEEQKVQTDLKGQFAVLLGAGSSIGLPESLFAAGEPRWLGVQVGDHEETRTLLTSVPYAMKAADADTLGGQAAGNFVTQEQLADWFKATAAELAARTIQPLLAATVTGSGTVGTMPIWTGASVLGNSVIYQVGSGSSARIGFKTTTPATTLDVGGNETVRGYLNMMPATVATAAGSVSSPQFEFGASSFLAGGAAIAQNFAWQALATGNNTATPSANLRLLFASGATPLAPTGLSIAANGVITFAAAQSFPSAATTFPKGATFSAESYFTGSTTDYMLKAVNSNSDGTGAIYAEGAGFAPGIVAKTDNGYGVLGLAGDGIAGGFGNTSSGNPTLSVSNTIGPAGDFAATSDTIPALSVSNGSSADSSVGIESSVTTGTALSASATNGTGIESIVGDGYSAYIENASQSRPTAFIANTSATGDALHAETGDGYAGYFSNSSSNSAALGVGNSNGAAILALSSGGDGVVVENLGASQTYTWPGTASVLGSTGDTAGYHAAIVGIADDGFAGIFHNDSATDATVSIYNAIGPTGLFRVLSASSPSGICGFGGSGDLTCTGQLKSVVSTASARQVETYPVQSSESWLEDYGSGNLENGKAVVRLDAAFLDAANTGIQYHVFLTPKGDAQSLYVTNETANSFEVRESSYGGDSIGFDYRIVAKRRGMESKRLVDVTEQIGAEIAANRERMSSAKSPGNAIRLRQVVTDPRGRLESRRRPIVQRPRQLRPRSVQPKF